MDTKDRIAALKSGKWKGNEDFLYWCPQTNDYVSAEWDRSNRWWTILWHEGRGWKPEELVDYLEKQQAETNGNSWNKQDSWGGEQDGWTDRKEDVNRWSDDPNEWASNLKTIDWHGVQLVAVTKNFYEECPSVTARNAAEVAAIRKHHEIVVKDVMGNAPIPNPVTTFEEASMPDWLQAGLERHFEEPTAIQIQGWPVALQGRDLVGIAETGSGKTLAYLAPMMIHIMAQEELKAGEGPVGIVLAPTRELAIQINSVAEDFAGESGLKSCCVYGGAKVRDQGYAVQDKVDIIVGTPGRLIHLLNERWTNLNRVTYVVLDEADEMLSKGFGDQMKLILSQVRPDRQMLMFSATWPDTVQELARSHCKEDPVLIRIGGDVLRACRSIAQKVTVMERNIQTDEDIFQSKTIKLVEALKKSGVCEQWTNPDNKALIFGKTKYNVSRIVQELKETYNLNAAAMHSDLDQANRIWTLEQFKQGEITILAATNCLGRGHDIKNVNFVINFDAPDNIESYIHRIGRTGRAGNQGFSLILLSHKDYNLGPDLIKVLESTGQNVPESLKDLARSSMVESNWSVEQSQAEGGGWAGYAPTA